MLAIDPRIGDSNQLPLSDGDRNALAKLLSLLIEPDGPRPGIAVPEGRAALAKKLYDQRRRREMFLPASLFSEPAWDILLTLYWAQKCQQRVSVSGVCASASAPPTTALRYIDHLRQSGFVVREKHPTDARMHWLSLTEAAEARMDSYFDWVQHGGRHQPGPSFGSQPSGASLS